MADERGRRIDPPPDETWRQPNFVISDDNLALCFDARCGEDFCYSAARKTWRIYNGKRWIDGGLKVEAAIGKFLREIAPVAARKTRDRVHIGSTKMLLAVERKLRSMREIDEGIFDADPYLLNCPSGTIDLRDPNCELRRHDRADYLTRMTAVDPVGDCPQWKKFMRFVTNNDGQLEDYLQRLAGYALVGVADEQMFAFLYGSGGNGKSVFLQSLLKVLGDYGVSCPSEVFTQQMFDRHPEELMRLRAARLIISSEIKPDCQWNETRIKAVTGGERIVARGMRENSVEFDLCGTLVIAGNNKPELHGVDEAIKRRMHLVPFIAHVEEEDINKHLGEDLWKEAGGILRWMLDGFISWQLEGLKRSAAVDQATSEYISDEDHVTSWRDECCDFDKLGTVRSSISELFASWKSWCEARGLRYGSINSFSTRLANSGVPRDPRHGSSRGFLGIALKPKKTRDQGDE